MAVLAAGIMIGSADAQTRPIIDALIDYEKGAAITPSLQSIEQFEQSAGYKTKRDPAHANTLIVMVDGSMAIDDHPSLRSLLYIKLLAGTCPVNPSSCEHEVQFVRVDQLTGGRNGVTDVTLNAWNERHPGFEAWYEDGVQGFILNMYANFDAESITSDQFADFQKQFVEMYHGIGRHSGGEGFGTFIRTAAVAASAPSPAALARKVTASLASLAPALTAAHHKAVRDDVRHILKVDGIPGEWLQLNPCEGKPGCASVIAVAYNDIDLRKVTPDALAQWRDQNPTAMIAQYPNDPGRGVLLVRIMIGIRGMAVSELLDQINRTSDVDDSLDTLLNP